MNTKGFSRCDDDDDNDEAAPLEFLCGNRFPEPIPQVLCKDCGATIFYYFDIVCRFQY
jgi:hypothetical protein